MHQQHKGEWKEFGNYLAQLLIGFDGNKERAAEELEIHPSMLSHYLAGDRKPKEEFLKKLSENFGVSYQALENLVR